MKSFRFFALAFSLTVLNAFALDPKLKNVSIEDGFRDDRGNLVLFFQYHSELADNKENPASMGSNLTYSCDAKACHQLQTLGSSSSSSREGVSQMEQGFADRHLKDGGRIQFDKKAGISKLTCGSGEVPLRPLSKIEKLKIDSKIQSGQLPLTPLPANRELEYAFLTKSGEMIYIDAPKYNYAYDFHVYKGKPGKMELLKLTGPVNRLHDGGTTRIPTSAGELFSPSGVTGKKATLNGEVLQRLDRADVDPDKLGIPKSANSQLVTPCSRRESASAKSDDHSDDGDSGAGK